MRVMLCLPGKGFSNSFVKCLSDLLRYFAEKHIEWRTKAKYSSNVFFCRNMVLGAEPGEPNEASGTMPFGGESYDYMLWIDSDAEFMPEDFQALVDAGKDVVAGITYSSAEEGRLSCGRLMQDGSTSALTIERFSEIPLGPDRLIEVDYTGFHFVLIKSGVMEETGYPWFVPFNRVVNERTYFPSEDIGWCLRARSLNKQLWVHADVVLGHEKSVVLKPRRRS